MTKPKTRKWVKEKRWDAYGKYEYNVYIYVDGEQAIAEVVKTGSHRDHYPWDWYFMHPLTASHVSGSGVSDTINDAKADVETRWQKEVESATATTG